MKTVRELMGEDDAATTTADIPGVPMPFVNTDRRTRVRRRKRRHVGEEVVINEWRTRPVGKDRWEVKVGKKWVQGKWRTIAGHHVFLKKRGGMLPKKGIIARIMSALSKVAHGSSETRRRGRSEDMETIRDVAARLMEGEASKSATKNVVELIALDAAEAPKVQRRLARLLGDKAPEVASELATALMPAVTKWLEAKGVRVQGVSAAEKALRTAAKE